MRLLLRKARRDLALHRCRSLLAAFALALALGGGGAVLVATWMVGHATEVGYRASLPVSATLVLDAVDERLVEAVRTMPGIADARARRVLPVSIDVDGVPMRAMLFAYGRAAGIGRIGDVEGTWPPRPGEIVIERSSPALAEAATGTPVRVDANGRSIELRVGGRARDVSVAPGWMEHTIYAFADVSTLAPLATDPGYTEIQFRMRDDGADRAAVREFAGRVAALARAQGRRVDRVAVPPPGEHVHAAQMRSLLVTQLAFAVLALAAAAVLVVVLVGAALAGEARIVGVLKALGAAPREVAMPYLAQAALVGALASAVALPFAAVAGRRYGTMKLELLNFPAADVPFPLVPLVVVAVIGVLLPPLAALRLVTRAARRPVAEALRASRVEQSARASLPAGRAWCPRSVRWALDNAFRSPRRSALAVFAIALGGAVHLGAGSLREAVRGSVDLVFASQRYDLALGFEGRHTPGTIDAIASRVDGIARSETWLQTRAAVAGRDGLVEAAFPLVGVPEGSTAFAPAIERGTLPRAAAVLVNRAVLRELHGGEVATLDLRIGAATSSWNLAGVMGGAPTPVAYTTRATLEARAPDASPLLVVTAERRDLAGQLELVRRLREAYAEAGIAVARSTRPDENRRVVESHLVMVVEFLAAMGALMLAVGACALGATMALAVLERDAETAVLRALGARHGRVFALVLLEAVVLALIAGLVAIPLSAPASLALGEAFGRVMFEVAPRAWPAPDACLRWLAGALAVAIVAAMVPAWRASRVPVARALRAP